MAYFKKLSFCSGGNLQHILVGQIMANTPNPNPNAPCDSRIVDKKAYKCTSLRFS